MKHLIMLMLAATSFSLYAQLDLSFCFNDHSLILLNNENERITDAKVYLHDSLATYDSLTKKYVVRYQVRDFKTHKDLPFHIRVFHPDYDTLDAMIYYGHTYREFYLFRKGESYVRIGGSKYGGQQYPNQLLAVLKAPGNDQGSQFQVFKALMDSLGLNFRAQQGSWHHSIDGRTYIIEKRNGLLTNSIDSICPELKVLQRRKDLFTIVGPAVNMGENLCTFSNYLSVEFNDFMKDEGLTFIKTLNLRRVNGYDYSYLFELDDAFLTEGMNYVLEQILSCPAVKGACYNSLIFCEML